MKVGDCPVSMLCSVIAFWLVDFAANVVQIPARALLTDVAPESQQESGMAWFSFMASLGSVAATFLGSLSLTRFFPFMDSQVQALYCIGAISVFSLGWLTLWYSPDGHSLRLDSYDSFQSRDDSDDSFRSSPDSNESNEAEQPSLVSAAQQLPAPVRNV